MGYCVINVVWLFPLAIVADSSVQVERLACAVALAPLCVAAWILGGGRDSREGRD